MGKSISKHKRGTQYSEVPHICAHPKKVENTIGSAFLESVNLKGTNSVQIVEEVGDAKQRFATYQVTGRAVYPQNLQSSVQIHDPCRSLPPSQLRNLRAARRAAHKRYNFLPIRKSENRRKGGSVANSPDVPVFVTFHGKRTKKVPSISVSGRLNKILHFRTNTFACYTLRQIRSRTMGSQIIFE